MGKAQLGMKDRKMLLSRSTTEAFAPHSLGSPQAAPRGCSRAKQMNKLPGRAMNENGVSHHRLHLALC